MRKTFITAAAATAALAATVATVPAQASGIHGHRAKAAPPSYQVVAHGLHNPRQLTFGAKGGLYVAEAGVGGNGQCFPAPGGGNTCYGATGSVTRVAGGHQHRILKGLASLGGSEAIGPSDLQWIGNHTLAVSIGFGQSPGARKQLPARGQKQMGHVVAFNLMTGRGTSVADLSTHEARHNVIDDANTDPTGLLSLGKGQYLAVDSGGNTLVWVKNGHMSTIAAFADRPNTNPGPPVYQAVPTDVVQGPDGAYYVSELTGFPFSPGVARIWRVVPGHKPTVYADGLTGVTSIAWDGKKLYAVQIADGGLQSGPPGSLVRVFPKSSGKAAQTVAPGLFFPYGVAIRNHAAYVTTGSVDPTGGQVVKIPLS